MSWIADREIKYRYRMPDETLRLLILKADQDAPQEHTFEDGQVGVYCGFEPDVVQQTNIVEFDKNGRKAVRIRNPDGTVRHVSKTKLNYMKTGRIENEYTKEYREHLEKTKQEQLLRTEHNTRRAKVSTARPEDVLKNLPDGEYVSDGKTVVPAPPGIADKKS